jgi:hypothetical protein
MKHSTRDQRRDVQVLRQAGNTHQQIADQTGLSLRQVSYALSHPPTPSKRSGRPSKLTEVQVIELIEYIESSKGGRQTAWHKLPAALGWEDASYYCIRNTLRRLGSKRYVAWYKPPISEVNRVKRLTWAQEHVTWTQEQWAQILWSDETWVTPGRHRKTRVTRKADEALEPTCIVIREQRKKGWMFWGSFSGPGGKGPILFWEKEWGTITVKTYCERVVPLICGWFRIHPDHQFMQDNAPPHRAALTLEDMKERGIKQLNGLLTPLI